MTQIQHIYWLRCAAALTIATGAVAALASQPQTAEPWRLLFDVLSWPLDGDPGAFGLVTRQVNAVLGGVMVGWGATILSLTFRPQEEQAVLARAIGQGLLCWFVVDSGGSLLAGLPGNVVLNVAFVVLFWVPLRGLVR